MAWCLKDITRPSRQLYDEMFQGGAREPQARAFWEEILDALIDASQYALRRRSEQPPVTSALSEHRRRRVDLVLDAFIKEDGTRTTVLFTEVKTANATRDDIVTVEDQAFDACKAYIESPECPVSVVYGMCVIGPLCRLFRYTPDVSTSWTALWGGQQKYDENQYLDVAHPDSTQIFRNLQAILNSHPAELSGRNYLKLNLPPQSGQPTVLRSQPAVAGSSAVGVDLAAEAQSAKAAYSRLVAQGNSPDSAVRQMAQAFRTQNPAMTWEAAVASVKGRLRYNG